MERATRSASVTDQAYTRLRDAILSGELRPNALYSVIEFAHELGVSRTPVREAVLRLADAGMVSVERNRGIRITSSNVMDVRCVFELRILLEVPAARAAARLADANLDNELHRHLVEMRKVARDDDDAGMLVHHRAFHEVIASALANDRMDSVLTMLRDGIRARSLSMPRSRSNIEIADEHAPIYTAIVARDAVAAGEAMQAHLEISGELLMRQVASVTEEPVPAEWATRFRKRVGP